MIGFPLVQAGDGERVEVVSVDGGRGVQRRLGDLGVVSGTHLEVVARQSAGPVLVAIAGSRVAVGFGMALKVRVRPVEHERGER